MNAFDFTVEAQDGSKVELSKFKGKVLVIVNTATGCGFTPQYSKVDVNGDNAIPFYKWITENTKFEGFSGPMSVILNPIVKKMDEDYMNNGKIKWNFTKIIVNREGEIVARFEPTAGIRKVAEKVREILWDVSF